MDTPQLAFTTATPAAVAARLGDDIHLWRIPYLPQERRAPLAAVLGAYLGVAADAVVLHAHDGGKPRLAGSPGVVGDMASLEFNWSHSGRYALIALARHLPLGVDIEQLAKRPRVLEIARRYFHADEAADLAALDSAQRGPAFIALWCAKEAVLKATGAGLAFGLARVAFRYDPASAWRLVHADPALGGADAWQLAGFGAAEGYRGALAWRGPPRNIVAFQPVASAR